MTTQTRPHPASYRDPGGFVFEQDGRIRRAVTEIGLENARAVRATGLVARLVASGRLLPEEEIGTSLADRPDVRLVLEHPRLPFVSYPYEWPFSALQAAALLHLDVQLEALDSDVMLSDATAYNVQFLGARPVFIDHLAFRPYRDGELWAAHRQFSEQFLHPLLLQSLFGVPYQPWLRGRPDGVPGGDLVALLRWRDRLTWRVLTHVVMPARLQRFAGRPGAERRIATARMPKRTLRELFHALRDWIASLSPRGLGSTTWAAYDALVPASETSTISAFVEEAVRRVRPSHVWDLGCNTGRYSEVALKAGASHVVGLDSDAGALNQAFIRARDRDLALLPLLVDLADPSPGQGWQNAERAPLLSRGRADLLVAVAVIHHLAIARNVPLDLIVELLTAIAPDGVIGFVPNTDARARALFHGRDELFRDYTTDNFLRLLESRARIVVRHPMEGGRLLLAYSGR